VTSIGWTQLGWAQFAAFEDIATGAGSAANAAVFLGRGLRARGARRAAALLLTGLFAALSIATLGRLVPESPRALEALLDAPLLVANLAVTTVLAMGARR
jgi:hypothetical protein